jgi:hypothetical protein
MPAAGAAPIPSASAPPTRTSADVQREIEEAKNRLADLEKRADAMPKAYAVMEGQPKNAKVQRKGEPDKLGDEVPRGFLTVLGGQKLPPEEKGSGRRELADWLTDKSNPLTARVMVNRIWQYHFGRGLVKSSNDFGVRGEKPTHPELLDWLASRFLQGGWSIKAMHRLIVLSHAYQMSSEDDPECSAKDVANDSLWRFNRRRMEAEELRDSFLAIAGTLDRGPVKNHPFPPEASWHYTQHKPFMADYASAHRSVYLMQQRFQKNAFLQLFDGADTNATTAVRPVSQTPVQALWALNSHLAHDEAQKLADRLMHEFSDEPARISNAFELAIGRTAEPDEIEAASKHIADTEAALADSTVPLEQRPAVAFASFARVLLTSNEFLFIE